MYILGIETATTTGSVGIAARDRIVAEYTLNIELTHSERLMATVDRVLSDTELSIDAMDGFAVSIGPGSFTGLRIGIATVKGLAFATGKPVAAVPTLSGLAWKVANARFSIVPLLDAKKREVYAARFLFEGGKLVKVMPETAISLVSLAEMIAGEALFTGEGAQIHRAEIEGLFGERAHFAPHTSAVPSGASIAELGLEMIAAGASVDPDLLEPLYVRRPEAEVAWEKKRQSR